MANYEITAPNGQKYEVTAPDTASEAEVLAYARQQFAAPPVSTGEVLKQAPTKALAGLAESVINTPANLVNLAKMAYGAGATALGRPDLAPEVSAPPAMVTDFLKQQNVIRDMPGMTPAQRSTNTMAQAATLALLNPVQGLRQAITNAGVAALGAGAGEQVQEATGSPAAGLLTSLIAPGAIGATSLASAPKREAAALARVESDTLNKARELGFKLVPEGSAANFAGRDKMAAEAAKANQQTVNSIARDTLGLKSTEPLTPKTFQDIRAEAYAQGYTPIKQLGPITTDADYLTTLSNIETKYSGGLKSFPDAAMPKVRKEIDRYLVQNFDAGDAVDRVRALRESSRLNIGAEKPEKVWLGRAQRDIADALEAQIERHVTQSGLPADLINTYRAARQRIAQSHTLEDTLKEGTGNISQMKLARALDRGEYMAGNIRDAARFAQAMPEAVKGSAAKAGGAAGIDKVTLPILGGAAGVGLSNQLNLAIDPWLASAIGAAAGRGIESPIQGVMRRYMMSNLGQGRIVPSESELKNMLEFAAPSALGLLGQ